MPGQEINTWKPLRFFTIYRLILAGLFAVLVITGQAPPPFGQYYPAQFAWGSYAYVAFSLLAGVAANYRIPAFQIQVYLQVISDIIFITLLMHASGGIDSGLGMLLIITIASGSMLTAGRTAGLFASLATIALLFEQSYLLLTAPQEHISYPQAGMLGAALFATAALAHTLARRLRESEALAKQRGIDLANMAQLTEYIIQNMQTGIVVIDPDTRVRFVNNTARARFNPGSVPERLVDLSVELYQQFLAWRAGQTGASQVIQLPGTELPLLPRFMSIGTDRNGATLIFLEEADAAARQVQQLKLASLGRLTASIAHEVRNPLGAISHAGELLGESAALPAGDQRLVQIILDQSRRVNTIIENILQLGRRGKSVPEQLDLRPWLERFQTEFCSTHAIAPAALALQLPSEAAPTYFDPSHLHQILWNLCQNGLRYSPEEHQPRLELILSKGSDGALTLDVRDFGPGIAEEARSQIFEPFYTTSPQGTGLGLYIARELAECNQAKLIYLPAPGGGAQFRLLFPRR